MLENYFAQYLSPTTIFKVIGVQDFYYKNEH